MNVASFVRAPRGALRVLVLLGAGCAGGPPAATPAVETPTTMGGSTPTDQAVSRFLWTRHLLPIPGTFTLSEATLGALRDAEERSAGEFTTAAAGYGEAAGAVLDALAAGRAPAPAEVDALVAAEAQVRELALAATRAGAAAVGPSGLTEAAGPGGSVGTLLGRGPFELLVGNHTRASLPNPGDLGITPAASAAAVVAGDHTRAQALDEAVLTWQRAVGAATDLAGFEAATKALSPALEQDLRERLRLGAALITSLSPEDRARLLLFKPARLYLGVGSASDQFAFAFGGLGGLDGTGSPPAPPGAAALTSAGAQGAPTAAPNGDVPAFVDPNTPGPGGVPGSTGGTPSGAPNAVDPPPAEPTPIPNRDVGDGSNPDGAGVMPGAPVVVAPNPDAIPQNSAGPKEGSGEGGFNGMAPGGK